eukprot:10571632-Prorocentrum_lima.AAC.1
MVVWNSTVNTRVRAKEPILVNKLVSRLKLLLIHDIVVDVYSSADQSGCQCRGPGRRFLLDSSFWRLWDVIAMSGWVTVSMLSFQSVYDLNDDDCDGFLCCQCRIHQRSVLWLVMSCHFTLWDT